MWNFGDAKAYGPWWKMRPPDRSSFVRRAVRRTSAIEWEYGVSASGLATPRSRKRDASTDHSATMALKTSTLRQNSAEGQASNFPARPKSFAVKHLAGVS